MRRLSGNSTTSITFRLGCHSLCLQCRLTLHSVTRQNRTGEHLELLVLVIGVMSMGCFGG